MATILTLLLRILTGHIYGLEIWGRAQIEDARCRKSDWKAI